MPSAPPAAPPRASSRPPQPGRDAPGGLLAGLNRRHIWALLLAGLCLAAPVLALGQTTAQTVGQAAGQTANIPEIVAAAPKNLPPYYVPAADGSPDGFAVEVLRRVATATGLRVRLVTTSSIGEAEALLRQGKVQVVAGIGISPARKQALDFTRPFETVPVHIFFRKGAQPLEDLGSLAGKRLALVAGSIPVERLIDRPEMTVQITQTLAEAIFDVLSGQADALIYLAPVVQQAASAAGVEHKLGRSMLPLFEVDRAIAVGRGNPGLAARLDTALHAFLDTGEYRALYSRWHPRPKSPHFTPVALWTMLALAAGLTAALLCWRSISLLRLNRRLTLAVDQRDRALAAQRLTEERLEALFTLAHMEAASTARLVDFALEQGVRLTGSKSGSLRFVDGQDETSAVWPRTPEDGSPAPEAADIRHSQDGLWADCQRTGLPSIVNDAPGARRMGVPLVENGRVLAMIGVGDKPEPYDETDARQLQLFLSGLWRVLKARRDANDIRQARDYAESLLEGANAMVIGLDSQGRVTAFNAAAEKITGHSRAEMLGQNWFTKMYPDQKAQVIGEHYSQIMDAERDVPLQEESWLLVKGGQRRLISWQNSLLRSDGEISGIIVFGIDITERRQAEEELRERSREILTLFNGVPALIFYKSPDNRILRANDAWFKTLGLDESILGSHVQRIFPLEVVQKFQRDDQEVLATGQPKMNIVEHVPTPKGIRRFVTHKLPRFDADGAVSGLICIATDVTELHLAEAALAESEEKFRTLAEDSPALICRFLPGGILTYVNRAICATFGRTQEEFLGTCLLDHVPPEERQTTLARFCALTPESPVAVAEQRVLLPGGRQGWQQWTDRALFDQAGNVIAYQSVGVDITARKEAERDMKRLYRAIEQAAEGVLISDRGGAIIYVNPALERMAALCGIEAGELGASVSEARQAAQRQLDSPVRMDGGGDVWRGTSSFSRPGGPSVEVEFAVSAIRDAKGEVTSHVAVCRDVTEKRVLERQLWQAQKMEALGTLAGGIAHDFNNILASIMGFTELALDDTPPDGRARGSLARVLKASSRAKELVRQILTFSRRSDREQRTLPADEVVSEALRLMEATLPKDIAIEADMRSGGCSILADPSQIHQIVMNLCTNATQAMRGGGRLSVRTRTVRLDGQTLPEAHRLQPGEYLSLTVEDTGPGIAPEILGRIFDPFFTTKDSGEGTGLGLAVVHGIATSLGGTVYAQSEPGQGARLTVLVPTVPPKPGAHAEASQDSPGGRERILLVDDETELLDLVRQALEPLGYQVAAHAQPEDALSAFLASPQSFDLVLTDQSMPRLTGLQLAARLREVRPDLPVVLCTGLSMVIPPDHLKALGEAWLLSKPFSTSELARVIRQALTGQQGGTHGAPNPGR